jgi:gamma-glutamyltranspeptidase/glutathione hydrolase
MNSSDNCWGGCRNGIATAPHALASQTAVGILREGGNAVEAMIAAAATIAVTYPHMNSIGGDAFWLILQPGTAPVGIEACGVAAQSATIDSYRALGLSTIPVRGPLAANTVAGTVSGWNVAHRWSQERLGGRLPLSRLLEDAIRYAREGVAVTASQERATRTHHAILRSVPGFISMHLHDGEPFSQGETFRQPRLAATLEQLSRAGLDDFYRGELARSVAQDLHKIGSPVSLSDLERFRARLRTPVSMPHSLGTLYNMPPPTQGLVSLLILGQLDRVLARGMDPVGAEFVHACVEATKLAFEVRDSVLTDPDYMTVDPADLLRPERLDTLAARIACDRAADWRTGTAPGDTVWMGVCDSQGVAVSFIQSIYHEFGSGVVLPESGIIWQNRGSSFSLDPRALNSLRPGRRPFHTLNPAAIRCNDGRTCVYGSMGGDGQPQFQAAVFSRIFTFGNGVQAALDQPRWLLGRTWGQSSQTLKLEARFAEQVFETLRQLGHDVERVNAYDETMGHAGAIVRHPDGSLEGGSDRRSDGAVAGW